MSSDTCPSSDHAHRPRRGGWERLGLSTGGHNIEPYNQIQIQVQIQIQIHVQIQIQSSFGNVLGYPRGVTILNHTISESDICALQNTYVLVLY